jgi:NhaP-type Na+/H+ or K+/H+ antiporter
MSILVIIAVTVLRFAWTFPVAYLSRKLIPRVRRNDPMPSVGTLTVLSWTGMRGIVSLAAGLAIPLTLPDGRPFPHRELLLFLTYSVIVFTLVVPTLTLSSMVRFFRLERGGSEHVEEAKARIAMADAALGRIAEFSETSSHDCSYAATLKQSYLNLRERLAPVTSGAGFSRLDLVEQNRRRIALQSVSAERAELLRLRANGELHDEFFHQLSGELDLEESRIRKNSRPQ